MGLLRLIVSRVWGLFSKRRQDAELADEIQTHLEALTNEYVRSGMSPADARAAARREFGGIGQMKETYRDQRGLPFVDALQQDLRYRACGPWPRRPDSRCRYHDRQLRSCIEPLVAVRHE